MSKSVLNQRYCYKINSDYIRRNKGNVEIKNIRKAIKNRFIVGMGRFERFPKNRRCRGTALCWRSGQNRALLLCHRQSRGEGIGI